MWWWHARKIKDKIPLFHITFEKYQQSLLTHSSFLADFRCIWPLFSLNLPFGIEEKMFGITWSILALFSPIVYNSFFFFIFMVVFIANLYSAYIEFSTVENLFLFFVDPNSLLDMRPRINSERWNVERFILNGKKKSFNTPLAMPMS